MASAPPLTPTPSWLGANKVSAFWAKAVLKHLATTLHKRFPIAIGRRLLSFFLPATSLAPQRKGLTCWGTLPVAMTFTSLVKAPRALVTSAAEVFLSTDFKCSGLIPDGPAPEPLGNESAAVETSDDVKDLGDVKTSI